MSTSLPNARRPSGPQALPVIAPFQVQTQNGGSTRLPFVHAHTGHNASSTQRAKTPAARMNTVNLAAQAAPNLSIEHALMHSVAAAPPMNHNHGQHHPRRLASRGNMNSTSGSLGPTSRLARLYPAPPNDTTHTNNDYSIHRSTLPFTPRALHATLVQTSPVVDYWMNQMQWEARQDYTNDLAIWESQLSQMLHRSGFDDLTPQRVALVCDLIDQISAHVGRWAPILRRIVRELFASIYQGYDITDLETTVPVWSTEGASWIGWNPPTFEDSLEQQMLDSACAPAFHPLSPLSDAHMYTPGTHEVADPLAPPPCPSDPQPLRAQYFRHELWQLNQATWHDIITKYEIAQAELIAHRAKVAQDLGMTLTKDGSRIVAQDGRTKHGKKETMDLSRLEELTGMHHHAHSHSLPPTAPASGSPSAQATPLFRSTRPSQIHTQLVEVTSSASQAVDLPEGLQHLSSLEEGVDVLTPLPSSPHVVRERSPSPPPPAVPMHRVDELSRTIDLAASMFVNAVPNMQTTKSPSPNGSPSNSRPVTSHHAERPGHRSNKSVTGSAIGGSHSRPMTAAEKQRQEIIDSAKSVVLAGPQSPNSSSHPLSPKFSPLTAQSMSALTSASVGSLVQQAMELSAEEKRQQGNGVHPHQEEKESIVQPPTSKSISTHGSPTPSPSTFGRGNKSSLSDTEAVTAAAFQTINSLISSPPIPAHNLIAFFDVNKRLNLQYDNLYKRIKNWAIKQTEMQRSSQTRDHTLNRICRKLKSTIYWNIFHRWLGVVKERKRQHRVFTELFSKYHKSNSHLQARFLAWRIITLKRKTSHLDRAVKETATKNLVLKSEINEQNYIREKELDKRGVLKSKEAALTKDRDEIRNFLEACQAQISSVQNAQITRFISGTIGMIQSSIQALWSELKEAREAQLQDPCKMLVSSTVLTEHITRPYTHMPEGSIEWLNARKDEVKKSKLKFQHMLDSDLLLLWFNFHLAQAHLKINQEKLSAKFYSKTYKYDVPGSGYPTHVKHFMSSDASLVRRAENFTSSLQDCEVLLRLLSQISPELCDVDILQYIDLEIRGKKLMKLIEALNHDIATTITPMDLTHSFTPDLMAALIARLMMNHTTLPVDTSIFVDKKKKKKSEYAPEDARVLTAMEQVQLLERKDLQKDLGLSDAAAKKAQELMREEQRAEAMIREAAGTGTGDMTTPNDQPSLMSLRDEAHVVVANRSRRSSLVALNPLLEPHEIGEPSIQELEEEQASRAVKDCGPFTEIMRALHLVNQELTTRARVEVNLVNHISGTVKKVLNDVRVLLDDAYERHALWLTLRKRVAAFVSIVMTHQMRGEPLIMQDRKSIRQIRRYTKLLDRSGKPQPRFNDLLHPWNRTSNDHMFRGGIKEESEEEEEEDESSSSSSESDEEDENELDENGQKREKSPKRDKKQEKNKNRKSGGGEGDEKDESSSSSSSSSSESSDDDDDSDTEDGGTRTTDGEDLWKEYKPLTNKQLATMPKEEQEREMRRLRNRNETQEDLTNQMTFELTKMQEAIAKHYTSIRDIFRAYAQMDSSTELAFKQREEDGVSKGTLKASRSKEDRDDPTASIRRKLREGMTQASSSASSTAQAHAEANPQFSIYEFWLMVRDTKLLTKHFTVKKCEKIFEYVWARDLKAALTASGHVDATHPFETLVKDKGKMEIDCRQFVEVLIRIAHQRMPSPKEREELLAELELDRETEMERKRSEGIDVSSGEISDVARQMDALTRASISIGQTAGGPGVAAGPNGASGMSNSAFEWGTPLFPTTRPGWALRLFGLLRCRLIPHAARLNVDHFRSQYKRIEVSTLYKKHGPVLRKLFYRYAKMHSVRGSSRNEDSDEHASDAVWTNTIDYKELISMLRDSKILDGRYLTLQQVYSIMANVQADLAKVAPPPQEKDSKFPHGKRGSLGKTTGKNEIVVVKREKSEKEKEATPATATEPATDAPVDGARRGSAIGTGVWGSNTQSGPVVNTLADLNLEQQAAATAVVPTDEQILASSATSNTELIFPEFLEALAAIACCRHPNPYRPLAVRLQHFLERDLLPWVALIFANKE